MSIGNAPPNQFLLAIDKMNKLLRVPQLLYAALLLVTPHQAQAQSQNTIAPADPTIVSPGGVDMRSGAYLYTTTDAEIGSGEGGLNLVRTRVRIDDRSDAPTNKVWGFQFAMTHNWTMRLYEHRVYLPSHYTYEADLRHDPTKPLADFRFFIVSGPSIKTVDWTNNDQAYTVMRSEPGSPPTWMTRLSGQMTGTPTYAVDLDDGTRITFQPLGQLCGAAPAPRCAVATSMTRPDGTQYTFSYSGEHLASVTSNRGFGIRFFYGAYPVNGPVHACLVNLSRSAMPTSYPCNGAGQLNVSYLRGNEFAVTKPDNSVERITIGASVNDLTPISFFRGSSTTPWLVNYEGTLDETMRQEFATGEIYTYTWSRALYADPPGVAGGTFTAPDGSVTTVNYEQIEVPYPRRNHPYGPEPCLERSCARSPVYQVSSGPNSVTDALGRITTADYCDPMVLTLPVIDGGGCLYDYLQSSTDPEGMKTKYTYLNRNAMPVERRQMAKPGSGLSDIVETAEYGCGATICGTAMTRYTDARGGATDYDVSPVHRQILSVTGPADANGIRPQTRYTYTQRNARDVNGTVLQPPVWVLSSEEYCRTTAAVGSNCVSGAADEVVTTYDYGPTTGPSNLLLRGVAVTADGQTLRTCYQYDELGRRISETKPLGTGATCP